MVVYEGTAVHKRHNELKTYQVEVPFDRILFGLPLLTVNRVLRTEEEYQDFVAVHQPTFIGVKVE